MSIFLYRVALDCSLLVSDTPIWFLSYLQLCRSKLRSFDLRIKLASLSLISYKKIRNPKPDDQEFRSFNLRINLGSLPLISYKIIRITIPDVQDMSILLQSVALDCSLLVFDTPLWFSSYLQLCISEFRSFDLRIKLASLALI